MFADVESEPVLFLPLKLELLTPIVEAQLEGWLLLRMSDYSLSGSVDAADAPLSVQLAGALTDDILDGQVAQKDIIAVWFEDHSTVANTVTVFFRLAWPYSTGRRLLQRGRALADSDSEEERLGIPPGSRSPILGDILVNALLQPPTEGAEPFVEGLEATLAGVSTTVLLKQEPLNPCEGDPGALQRGFCVRDGQIIRLNRGNGTITDVALPDLDAEVTEAERKTNPGDPESETPVHVDDNLASYIIAGLGVLVLLLLAFAVRRHFQYVETMEEIHARDNPEPPKEKPDENPREDGEAGQGEAEPEAEAGGAERVAGAADSILQPAAHEGRSTALEQAPLIDDSTDFTALQITPVQRRASAADRAPRHRALSSDGGQQTTEVDANTTVRATSTEMSVVSLHSSACTRKKHARGGSASRSRSQGNQYRIDPQHTIDFDDAVGAVFIPDSESASESTPHAHPASHTPPSSAARSRSAARNRPQSPLGGIQAPFSTGGGTARQHMAVRFADPHLAPPYAAQESSGLDSPGTVTRRAPAALRSSSEATDQDAVRLGSSGDSTVPSLGSKPFPSSEGTPGAACSSSGRVPSKERRRGGAPATSSNAKVSLRYLVRRQTQGKTDADGSTQSGGTTEPDVWSVGDDVSVAMQSRRVSSGTQDISSGR